MRAPLQQDAELSLRADEHVLRPRPFASALGRQVATEAVRRGARVVADLGTGCGVVALTIAAYAPELEIWATELRPEALEIARENAQANGLEINLALGDWFAALPASLRGCVDIAVATPPYLTQDEYELEPAFVRAHTPRLVMLGGSTGLEPARTLARSARSWLKPDGTLYLESHPRMTSETATLLEESGYDVRPNHWMPIVVAHRKTVC